MPQEKFFKEVLDNLYDGVYFVDYERRFTYWNHGAERISGFAVGNVIGHRCADNMLMHVNDRGESLCQSTCPLTASMGDAQIHEAHVYLHHKDGYRVPVLVRVAPMRDDAGRIVGAVESFSDNSELIAAQVRVEEMNEALTHDALTGVHNRHYLQMKIETGLTEMHRHGRDPFGVLFLDIDHFKQFNDTYGHDVGDQVLKMVAETLRRNIRATDSVGRWGGEELVVLLAQVQPDAVLPVADGMKRVSVSVGVAMARRDDSMDSVVKRADQAMYASKAGGRNRVTLAD